MGVLLLLIVFILGTEGFGFSSTTLGINISTPIGTIEIGQILLIIVLLICFIRSKRRKINIKESVLFPIIFLILFIFFQFFRNIAAGLNVQLALRGIKRIYMIFYIFPLIILIKNRSQLQKFINYILLIGFISALVAIYQFLLGTSFGASKAAGIGGGFSRIYHPGAVLMAFCFFISLSHFLIFGIRKKYYWMYVLIPFYLIGVIVTLHRNLIGATLFTIVLIIAVELLSKGKINLLWKPIFGGIILFLILSNILQKSGFGMEQLLLRGRSAIIEIKYFEGNYAGRWEILSDTFSRIIKESPLIGKGYQYEYVANILGTYYITNDSTYSNILVLFGLIGIIVWLILMYKIAILSLRMYINTLKLSDKALYLTILVMPIFFTIIGFFSAIIIYSANLTVLITIIGILYLLIYFQKQPQIVVNTIEPT